MNFMSLGSNSSRSIWAILNSHPVGVLQGIERPTFPQEEALGHPVERL